MTSVFAPFQGQTQNLYSSRLMSSLSHHGWYRSADKLCLLAKSNEDSSLRSCFLLFWETVKCWNNSGRQKIDRDFFEFKKRQTFITSFGRPPIKRLYGFGHINNHSTKEYNRGESKNRLKLFCLFDFQSHHSLDLLLLHV